MNKKQYNNVIEHTLKYEWSDNSLETARNIFNNMGVALPQGDMKTVYEIIKTNTYMGWRSCTIKEAREATQRGTAAIGISEYEIIVFSATDEEQPITQAESVMPLAENVSAYATDGLQYYVYSSATTTEQDGVNTEDDNYDESIMSEKKAIIIIPGIMGSELFAGEQIGDFDYGTKLWDPSYDLQADDKIRNLSCNSNGESVYRIYAGNENYGAQKTYKRLFERLTSFFSSSYDVVYFPYDWRTSCADAAHELDAYINSSNYDKVILVAHSMGGLVASNYLAIGTQQRSKVEKLIVLGSPFLGAAELIRVYLNGMNLGFVGDIIVNDDIKDIIPNIKSVYELLPTKKWFELTNNKIFTYTKLYTVQGYEDDGKTVVAQTYEDTKENLYENLHDSNTMLLSLAEDMHSHLFVNNTHITNLVDSYYIVGTNCPTVNSITAVITGDTGAFETISFNKTNNGDGTVITDSANIGSLCPNKTYYAAGREHCGEYDFDENRVIVEGLVVSENVIQLIKNIINNSSTLPNGINKG